MLVLQINHACSWVQITTGSGNYTCPMKEVNGELLFRFKGKWHKVDDYKTDLTGEYRGPGRSG